MFAVKNEKLWLKETPRTVTSISTQNFVPQPVKEKIHYIQNRLFIGGIPKNATSKDLAALFKSYGRIISSNIIDSVGCLWNYGFATFHPKLISASDIVLAEYSHGKNFCIDEKILKISRALFKPKKQTMSASINGDVYMPMNLNGGTVMARSYEKKSGAVAARDLNVPPPYNMLTTPKCSHFPFPVSNAVSKVKVPLQNNMMFYLPPHASLLRPPHALPWNYIPNSGLKTPVCTAAQQLVYALSLQTPNPVNSL